MIQGINFPAIGKAERHREQQTTGRGTFVPLVFQPGETFQFDWSEDFAVLGGERTKLQVAHIKLSHSRAFLLRAYPLQTHEMLFDAMFMRSGCSAVFLRAGSMTICALLLIVSAGARSGRSMPGF